MSTTAKEQEARVFKLFKEKVQTDVRLKRIVAANAAKVSVIDSMVCDELIFQLSTLLTVGDPKITRDTSTTNFGYVPDLTFWNIFKLAMRLIPGLPYSIKSKIHVKQHECIGESENTFITRHICPHYHFDADVKHLGFLMGLDDLEKDV